MICEHLSNLVAVEPTTTAGCQACLTTGDQWVHLRMCMACGHVRCCDSSPNRHAREHHRTSDYHVIQGFEPGERWAFCYPHRTMLEDVGDDAARAWQP